MSTTSTVRLHHRLAPGSLARARDLDRHLLHRFAFQAPAVAYRLAFESEQFAVEEHDRSIVEKVLSVINGFAIADPEVKVALPTDPSAAAAASGIDMASARVTEANSLFLILYRAWS